MPLSKEDLQSIKQIIDVKFDERMRKELQPIRQRLDTHSGEYREIVHEHIPDTRRRIDQVASDAEEDRMAFERFMVSISKANALELANIKASIHPAAVAAHGAESAAVAGAHASIDGKTNSLAARKDAQRAAWASIISLVIMALWKVIESIIAHSGPP